LLSSSVTIHSALKALNSEGQETAGLEDGRSNSSHDAGRSPMLRVFRRWWSATIVLGIVFLAGTAYGWSNLIGEYDLTISRNLFGSTYYTLVGFHALHVTVGVLVMLTVLGVTFKRSAASNLRSLALSEHAGIELVSWYWHFVDAVWIVVFSV